MRGFRIFGEYLFEYFVLTALLILSLVLVLPFIPIYIGVISYFMHKRDDRMFKDIFVTIKENIGIIIKFTIFELIILVTSFLNVYFFRQHMEGFNIVILVISYIFLILGIIFLAHAPMIIIGMNVNLRQLIYNTFLFFFGGVVNSFIAIIALGGLVVAASYVPYVVIPLIYFAVLAVEYFTNKNFLVLKAKKLKTSVYELTKKQNEDIYFDEEPQNIINENEKGREGKK